MRSPSLHDRSLQLFAPPYDTLEPVPDPTTFAGEPGRALVWHLGLAGWGGRFELVRGREPGVSLVIVLPPSRELAEDRQLLRAVETCRPHSILPHHEETSPEDLRSVLSRIPPDLPNEFADYLRWRGVSIDLDTRHLIRRTIELSLEVRTVRGLARGLYMSRRALGRRFMRQGLPVPSHWLHFARVLRAGLRLQGGEESLLAVAYEAGYADGFALSNQMHRLTGIRPREARRNLGWEWIVESWLRCEERTGGLDRRQHLRFSIPRMTREAAEEGASSPNPAQISSGQTTNVPAADTRHASA